eukprot:15333127-Ditylum_brightwellii.AAC.1
MTYIAVFWLIGCCLSQCELVCHCIIQDREERALNCIIGSIEVVGEAGGGIPDILDEGTTDGIVGIPVAVTGVGTGAPDAKIGCCGVGLIAWTVGCVVSPAVGACGAIDAVDAECGGDAVGGASFYVGGGDRLLFILS